MRPENAIPSRPRVSRLHTTLVGRRAFAAGCVLTAVVLPSARALAYGHPFETYPSHATDGAANATSVFLLNPAAFLPQGVAFGLGESLRRFEVKQERQRDTNIQKISSQRRDTAHGAGLLATPSAGFTLGLGVRQHLEEVRSKNDSSRYDDLPAEEKWVRREAQARFALELTKNFRMGAGFRYQYFKGDVLGSFNIPPNEMSTFKGTLYGALVGAHLAFDQGGFGLVYATPLRGKVGVQGESKVTTDPGLAQAAGHWTPAANLTLGFTLSRWFHEKDELAEPTTGPNPRNQTRITLMGLSPDARYLAHQTVGVGADWRLAGRFGLRVTPYFEQGEYAGKSDTTPGEKNNAKNRAKAYRARASLLLADKAFEVQVGADYAPRAHTIARSATDVDKTKTTELHTFATVNLVF